MGSLTSISEPTEWRTQLQPVVVVVDAEVSEIADVVAVDAVVVAADPVAADAERRERRNGSL